MSGTKKAKYTKPFRNIWFVVQVWSDYCQYAKWTAVPFWYEKPLFASDGSFYLPDFTVMLQGEEYYLNMWAV